mgnify:CR=1 FL=1
MFERFTERARQVVVLAQDEARALKHNYIGTEHILLGLLREEEGLASRVLESLEDAPASIAYFSPEYGITEVSNPIHVNRALRRAGWLRVREEQGREMLAAMREAAPAARPSSDGVWVTLLRFCRKKPLGAAGGVIMLLIAFAAIFANALQTYDPIATDAAQSLAAPSREHWLGDRIYSGVPAGTWCSVAAPSGSPAKSM